MMPYDVTIPYDLNIWNVFLDTIKISIRSISGMGFYILAFVLGWTVLIVIINRFTAVSKIDTALKKRSFTRKVFEADFNQNQKELIEDGVLHRRLNLSVNNRMHKSYFHSLVEDGVNKRLQNLSVNKDMNRKHVNEMVEDGVNKRRLNLLINKKMRKNHIQDLVEDRVGEMEVSAASKAAYADKHSNKKAAANYYKKRGSKK